MTFFRNFFCILISIKIVSASTKTKMKISMHSYLKSSIFSDVNACEKSIATIHAIENERKARDKDWTEAKTLKEKLQDPEVDQKMEDLIQLQSKMIDVNQKQLTNLQIGTFFCRKYPFELFKTIFCPISHEYRIF